jgi:hypothetical protein
LYLDGGTVGHSLVRVDGLVELLSVEEVLQQLLDLGNPEQWRETGIIQCKCSPRLLLPLVLLKKAFNVCSLSLKKD